MTKSYLCPVDQNALVMSDRQGIEIDYCPVCRGVWLDKGELDKIIERSKPPEATPAPKHPGYMSPQPLGHSHYKQGKRKKSFLEQIFD